MESRCVEPAGLSRARPVNDRAPIFLHRLWENKFPFPVLALTANKWNLYLSPNAVKAICRQSLGNESNPSSRNHHAKPQQRRKTAHKLGPQGRKSGLVPLQSTAVDSKMEHRHIDAGEKD